MDLAHPRHAIYYAPPPGSPLDAFGARWLGRHDADLDGGRWPLRGFSEPRLTEIVAPARHYGFHATLKPPFALAPECTIDDLDDALRQFAARQEPFLAPRLNLAVLDGFLALTLSGPCRAMDALAERCVRDFDRYRASLSEAELAQRRSAGLTPRQDALLQRWGYPYVMAEFRFHMTLTGRLDGDERERLQRGLAPLVAPLCAAPLPIDAVTLFVQRDRIAPFDIARRYPFGTGAP